MPTSGPDAAAAPARPEPRLAPVAGPVALGGAVLVMAFDSTAVPVALPSMARAFGIDELSTSGLISVYLIAAICPLPLVAWIGDRIGPRRALIGLLAGSVIGALLCGLARGMAFAIAGRILMGACGSMFMPFARLIITRTIPRERLVQAFAAVTLPVVIGPVIGPPVAGFLVSLLSWRAVPLAVLPIIVAAALGIMRFVPAIPPKPDIRFDAKGAALASLFLLLAATGLATGVVAMPLPGAVAMLALAALVGWAYRRHAARAKAPIVDLRLWRFPAFRHNSIAIFLTRLVTYSGPFLVTMYFEVGLGFPPEKAGMLLLFSALGSTVSQVMVARIVRLTGSRAYILAAACIVPVSFAAIGLIRHGSPAALIAALLFVQGFMRSGQLVVSSALSYNFIPASKLGQANNIVGITQQFSGNAGMAVAALAMAATRHLAAPGMDAGGLLRWAFVVVALVSTCSIPFFLRLPKNETATRRRAGD